MMYYDSLLARSFSKHEQKKLGYGAMLASFLVALSFFTFFMPHLAPPNLSLRLRPVGSDHKLKTVNDTIRVSPLKADAEPSSIEKTIQIDAEINTLVVTEAGHSLGVVDGDYEIVAITDKEPAVVCNILDRSDFCEATNGDIRVDGKTGTVFVVKSEFEPSRNVSWNIRPYGRKGDKGAMDNVREWEVKIVANSSVQEDDHQIPICNINHNVPGIIFSTGGYSGNHFHSFTDILVPLFATTRPFDGEVKFLVTDRNQQPGWFAKFETLLKGLSSYEPIDIDSQQVGRVIHCFPSIIVGLKHRTRKELSIDPTSSPYTIKNFMGFLRSKYSLKRPKPTKLTKGSKRPRPRLAIIARRRSRTFTNIGQINKLGRRLGFNPMIIEPKGGDLSETARLINSCDVVLGVHGAGLTNSIFLPEGAILIQVVPFGGAEWLSTTYFGGPSQDMGLNYLEYKVGLEESTLGRKYPPHHLALRDPEEIKKQGWEEYKRIYMDNQNIILDVNRFRPTLVKALEILRQ